MAYETHHQYSIFDWIINNNLDPNHKLMKLAKRIDWDEIRRKLSKYYSTRGRKAKRIRMMVALHMLKHMYNLSDQQVVEGLKENLYWMVFCGVPTEEIVRGEPLSWLNSSTMTKFRKRIGPEGIKEIEATLLDQILSDKRRCPRVMIADTTCMEKHIAYPTDSALLDKGRRKIIKIIRKIKESGADIKVKVRSWSRLGKKALGEINRFGRKSKETMERGFIRLSGYAEEVVSKVPEVIKQARRWRKGESRKRIERFCKKLEEIAEGVKRVLRQTKARLRGIQVSDKIYSLEEPQVACITKGKRSKPHEYGSKVSLAIADKGYVITHREYPDNRGDNRTLGEVLRDWQEATGRLPDIVSLDRSYRFKKGEEPVELLGIQRVVIPLVGKKSALKERRWWFSKYRRKRSKIEAVISHLKQDHRMNRCRYRGFEGDQINVSLAVIAWNMKKLALDTG
ncbi:MAG: IS5 family transposase [bacterium]